MEIRSTDDPVAFDLVSRTIARIAESRAKSVTPEVLRQTLSAVAAEDPRSSEGSIQESIRVLLAMYLSASRPGTQQ